MLTLKQAIQTQQGKIATDRALLKQRQEDFQAHARRRARSPVGLSLGFAGGLALGLRRPAWKRDDARSLLRQGIPLARMFLSGLMLGRG